MYTYYSAIIFGIAGGGLSACVLLDGLHRNVLQTKYRKYLISEGEYAIQYKSWLKNTCFHAVIIYCLFVFSIYLKFFA